MRVDLQLLLECIRASYREQVLPHIAEGVARSYGNVIASLLDQLANRLELEETLHRQELVQLRALLGEQPPSSGGPDGAGLIARLNALAEEVEGERARVSERFAGRLATPAMQAYLRDQLERDRQLYAIRASDKVY